MSSGADAKLLSKRCPSKDRLGKCKVVSSFGPPSLILSVLYRVKYLLVEEVTRLSAPGQRGPGGLTPAAVINQVLLMPVTRRERGESAETSEIKWQCLTSTRAGVAAAVMSLHCPAE